MKAIFSSISVLLITMTQIGCTHNKAELGTEKNPIKIHFLPSVDTKVLSDSANALKDFLEKKTEYKIEITIPQSYIAVVEAFGTKRADIAAINTFGYLLANQKYGAQAKLTVIRHGSSTYQSQFITRADSPINKVEDLAGKKLAFVDPASTSGYLLPMKTLKDKNILPKETMFAMKHDSVVTMIYQKQVDAGATFYSPPSKDDKGVEQIEDARRLVLTQFPDVAQKIKIIQLSDSIPNDPIIFRKNMPPEMVEKITKGFEDFLSTPEGRDAFFKIYGVTAVKRAQDSDYDSVRKMLLATGKDASELMSK